MKRKPIVGMSLKNYINTHRETKELCYQINLLCGNETKIEQFIFPSLGTLTAAQMTFLDKGVIQYGAQNIGPQKNGALTGEYSIESMLELGGNFVEIGHNERINLFFETSELINAKIKLALAQNATPVVCIGEGNQKVDKQAFVKILEKQLNDYFKGIQQELISKVVFAYEPGWAIGKSEAADASFVHDAHTTIRFLIRKLFGNQAADCARIIYGGSVSKENTAEITTGRDVDGVFIGRFGHDPKNYAEIVATVKKIKEMSKNE